MFHCLELVLGYVREFKQSPVQFYLFRNDVKIKMLVMLWNCIDRGLHRCF